MSGEESLRTEISKLKEFSKRLQTENQTLQSASRDVNLKDESHMSLYNQSLERVNQLVSENAEIRNSLEEYRLNQQNFNARYEALEKAKNREIEDLKISYSQLSKETVESNLLTLRNQYQSEVRKYELEIKSLKDKVDDKNKEIVDFNNKYQTLYAEMGNLQGGNEQIYQLQHQIAEYENRFVIFGQEIERLNITLRDYTGKLEEAEAKKRELERRVEQFEFERRDYETRMGSKDMEINHLNGLVLKFESESQKVGESSLALIQFETKVSSLTRDNEQLNSKLRMEVDTSRRYKEELDKLMYESTRFKLLEKDNEELKGSVNELNALRKRTAELENRAMIASQEIERLGSIIKSKDL